MKKISAFFFLIVLLLTACAQFLLEEPVFNNPADSTSYAYVGEDGNVAAVEGFAISSTETTIDLSWTAYPATGATVKVLRKEGSQPSDYSDGTEVFSKSGCPDSFSDTDITVGTDYYYGVYATGNGQNSQMVILRGRTLHYFAFYNANGATGGSVPVDSTLYKTDDTVTVSDNTGSLVKTGFLFRGWNTKADGTGTAYSVGSSFTMGTEDVVLYAQWRAVSTNSKGMNMITILSSSDTPVSTTLQGSTSVTLTRAFAMSETEVTQAQFIQFLNSRGVSSNGSYNSSELIDMDDSDCAIDHNGTQFVFSASSSASTDDCPVIEVTWYGAVEFCNWLSEQEGKESVYNTADWSWDPTKNGYRLPTESEWEYAAKGGASTGSATDYTYAGSDTIDDVAWYSSNSGSTTHSVKGKQANGYGLYDMSGNVWEWCSDWYSSSYSGGSDPAGASSGSYRVIRGGSCYSSAFRCTVSYRRYRSPHKYGGGFRIVSSP